MHKIALFIIAASVLVSACTNDDLGTVGTNSAALGATNALAYNRLVYNRLVYNRLAYSRLSTSDSSIVSLADTVEGRDLLHYLALCSLREGDSLSVTSRDVTYIFAGSLGLAPAWKQRGLTVSESRWVSACLLAHVNAFGVSVLVSMRANGKLATTHEELRDFPIYEATFFGEVFGDALRTYGCIGTDSETALALSPDRALRVCADGTGECEITSLGYCRDICEQRTENGGWTGCMAGGVRYEETVSTYLPAYESMCTSDSSSDSFSYVCSSSSTHSTCNDDDDDDDDDDDCTVHWQGANYYSGRWEESEINVSGGSRASIDCFGSESCEVRCEGDDTHCDIDCYGAEDCNVDCLGGAECVLTCKDAEDCAMPSCQGTLQVCGDTLVCNGVCPQ